MPPPPPSVVASHLRWVPLRLFERDLEGLGHGIAALTCCHDELDPIGGFCVDKLSIHQSLLLSDFLSKVALLGGGSSCAGYNGGAVGPAGQCEWFG